ncbi:MAG: serine protease, partial [Thermoleophilia bacterium]|nr:serine protease [Thermoleophilia bacterium]
MQLSNPYLGLAKGEAMIVRLDARSDLTAASAMPRGPERKQAAWDALEATAARSQIPFLSVADALHGAGLVTDVQSLTSPNALIVTPKFGAAKQVFEAFQVAGVDSIWSNFDGSLMWSPATGIVEPPLPGSDEERGDSTAPAAKAPPASHEPLVNWGLEAVGAPEAWALGATGAGMVFGSIDSGVEGVHPALRENYRGRLGEGRFDDDYSWIDLELPITSQPTDQKGHGTHTSGSAVGAGVGVAPEAKWIAVSATSSAADSFLKALQWMQAPTKVDGTAPDATMAPDVVGMSWGFGIEGQDLFGPSFAHLQAAGIELVKSAGNDGPEPSTVSTPANYDEVI